MANRLHSAEMGQFLVQLTEKFKNKPPLSSFLQWITRYLDETEESFYLLDCMIDNLITIQFSINCMYNMFDDNNMTIKNVNEFTTPLQSMIDKIEVIKLMLDRLSHEEVLNLVFELTKEFVSCVNTVELFKC